MTPRDDVVQIRLALHRVGVENIFPRAYFRNHYIFSRECFFDGSYAMAVGGLDWWTIRGAVPEATVFASKFTRIVGPKEDRTTEADGPARCRSR